MCTFLKKRGKLIAKYWGNENTAPMNAQIPFTEVVSFISSAFSKQLPFVGALVFHYLYRSNTKSMAGMFGYSYLYDRR